MAQHTEPVVLWQPTPERKERSTLTRFARWLREERGLDLPDDEDYGALWRWSVEDVEGFWQAIWDFFEVRASSAPERVLGQGPHLVELLAGLRRALRDRPLRPDRAEGALCRRRLPLQRPRLRPPRRRRRPPRRDAVAGAGRPAAVPRLRPTGRRHRMGP